MHDDMMEIFSPPRVLTIARRRGLKGTWSIDRLTAKSDGTAWDLNRKKDQLEVLSIIDRVKPALIIGSPPCSWFSRLMALNWKHYTRAQRRSMMDEARGLLKFSTQVYQKQMREGRLFLHEHPSTAQSWDEQCITDLMKQPSVIRVTCDMCRYNLRVVDSGKQKVT